MLVRYIRAGENCVGCLISDKIEGKVCVGWTLLPTFRFPNKKKVLEMAKARCLLNEIYGEDGNFIDKRFPLWLYKYMPKFLTRVKKRFKDSEKSLFVSTLFDYFDKD